MRSVTGALLMLVTASTLGSAQVAAVPGGKPSAERAAWNLLPESRLWIEGTSTVQSYTCEAERLEIRISASPAANVAEITELQSVVRGADLSVPVATLECGNNTMNGHMRNALKADENPAISFRLSEHEVQPQSNTAGYIRLVGQLTIAGETRPIVMEVMTVLESGNRLRVTGGTELKMTEFGVRPPRLMLGTLRVHDPVKVNFDLVINPQAAGS